VALRNLGDEPLGNEAARKLGLEPRMIEHGKPDMTINLTRRTALIGLSSFVASQVRAQTNPPTNSTPDAAEPVSLEAPAVFDITPTTGTLKETVQKGQQLIWRGKGPNDRRFQVTDISVAFLRNEGGGEVKMTFAGRVSSLGYRPVDEAKLNVIVRTKSGASIHSWNFDISVRCSDNSRPFAPVSHEVPRDIAANVLTNVGSVEIADYREPNYPRVMARRCPHNKFLSATVSHSRAAEQRDELTSCYVEHGLPSGTRCASLPQAQDARKRPAGPWGGPESL
jgi:hypothetical protein